MLVLKAVVQYNVIVGVGFFNTQILHVCVSSECLFISGLQSLPEVYCNRWLCLIFLFVPGIRANEDSGCYRGEGVSRWGTYHFSGTRSLNFSLSFSFLCFFFPFWNWLIEESYYLDQLDITYSFNISNLLNHFLNGGEWPVCFCYNFILLLQLLDFSSLICLFLINGLCKVSRRVCLKKLKLNVCLCNFPWKPPARLFIGT